MIADISVTEGCELKTEEFLIQFLHTLLHANWIEFFDVRRDNTLFTSDEVRQKE